MILKQFWTKVLCLKRKRNCPLCWLGIRFKAALSYSFPFENHELSMGLNMRSTLKQFSPIVLFKKFLSIPFPPLIWDQLLKLVSCSLPLDNEELSMELFWNHLWSRSCCIHALQYYMNAAASSRKEWLHWPEKSWYIASMCSSQTNGATLTIAWNS